MTVLIGRERNSFAVSTNSNTESNIVFSGNHSRNLHILTKGTPNSP